ncbi:MAG: Unknown protein [uncultured Sulfurovum sp.]|uniref:UspA domain-containing protein n=1 Tax=uncultured Sulfurovum sp. TaxID=269237 RepID=A0A6S6SIP1_9BACT|nr:MAG: Unknown protein [uncultured Sulfurovum sp.]
MKHKFKRVVILLNDLENVESILKKGVLFANEHNALLEVLFVHEVPLFEVPDYFLSNEKISETILDKEKVKEDIEKQLETLNFENEQVVFVYANDTVDRVLNLIKASEETLVLTQYHKELSSQLVEKTPYTYWIVKKEEKEYKNIAFTIDLQNKFKPYLPIIAHIFPKATIELIHNYRYMLDPIVTSQDYLIVDTISKEVDIELNQVVRDQKIKIFEEYQEKYELKGTFLEGDGIFNDDLIQYIQNKNFNLTVLHRDNDDIFFTPTLIKDLMEEITTDFFIFQSAS